MNTENLIFASVVFRLYTTGVLYNTCMVASYIHTISRGLPLDNEIFIFTVQNDPNIVVTIYVPIAIHCMCVETPYMQCLHSAP